MPYFSEIHPSGGTFVVHLSAFCYDRPEDWDFDPKHTIPYFSNSHEEYDALFMEEPDDVAEQLDDGFCYKLECWKSEKGHGRNRSKEATLRSWRDDRSLGGSQSRKAVVRKMDRRRPVRHAIWGGSPEPCAVG